MKQRIIIFLINILILMSLASCRKHYVYNHYESLPDKEWRIEDTLSYNFYIDDTINPHSLSLNIRYNNDYPYRNLYIFAQTIYPDMSSDNDTLQLYLSASDGSLYGKGIGDIKEIQFILNDNIIFADTGIYSLNMIHGMRDDNLSGIDKIGFVVTKSNKTNE
ncbi:MAG: gliding motility lipoprotein GldH [Bacteroidales bacterium]|jgi:gliding motility-associated lipoprotein GldH|nr:gliding motility lipoprotein GldH [Bacteroidales bacterium]MDD3151858.1 gliding motility lipoprotein GldH [Bacteroidales bacterium]MDD3914394.1 gliding motility lipoprotein GldH [Bacteroidales bacterium]MDD4633488.1 gliding motility lipoprotein GldH [Bacteroidales bacterium]